MTESPGTAQAGQANQEEKSSWAKFRDFVTSTAGLVTGLATIVTAAATIIGVLWNGSNHASPAVSHTSSQGAPAQPTESTANASPEKPRVQWGPGSLLITNNGTSLSTVPPSNDQEIVGDVYASYSSIEPFAGTTLLLWTENAQPTAQQCQYLAQTQGNPGQGVNVVPGSIVCAVTAEGPIAIINVTSLDDVNATIETRTTVWDLPSG
jgi:hypothetical protein